MYKVTIAIPVYNSKESIELTLLSALNQTFQSIEYLIIDDKGTDNSIGIIHNIIQKHKRGKDIKIIDHIYNRGIGATKNTAIDNATGEYLFFLDSDDYITPNCIEKLYKASHGKECCYGSYITCDKSLEVVDYQRVGRHEDSSGIPALAHHLFMQRGKLYIQTWNKLYKTSFLRKNNIRCSPNTNVDDVFFSFQIQYYCRTFKCIPDVTYYYLLHSDSTTSGMGGLKYDYAIQLADAYKDIETFIRTHPAQDIQWGHEQTVYYHNKWFIKKVLESKSLDRKQRISLLKDRFSQLRLFGEMSQYNKQLVNVISSKNQFTNAKKFIKFLPYTPVKKRKKDPIFLRLKNLINKMVHKAKKYKIGEIVTLNK